ncbi:lipopolysaccharide heptosyltransferase II [Halioglobus maricola]|uniref:lipopolysaccharide heptosyltransferase II n=1 Tax=Halioglobus maricola TaxID=2601894 RepID=A0A5P9NN33_9GAMM|nr:lipopolysaccharide heptosyltransferase II [Halioglobus maricola]QFU77283.1 lipopolysaccharide heptosyltransferase II [Halioglobus maricola]
MTSQQLIRFAPSPRRVLLVLPDRVGEVAMATPFIRGLFARFPEAQIHLLMNRPLLPLLEGSPWLNHAHFHAPRDKTPEAKSARQQLLSELKAQEFDLAVMLPDSLRSAWLCFRADAKHRLGFSRNGRGLLLTDRVAVPNKIRGGYEPMPLCDYYAVLAAALGMAHPGDELQLFLVDHADAAVVQRLAGEGVRPEQPLVVLCPGAGFGASRYWPPERFAEVADQLVRRFGAAIVIPPGPGEEALAELVRDAMHEQCFLLTEPCLSLGELKSLIADADLLLGNDTGPRQFGRAFDTPLVTVFGPTEQRWTDTSYVRESIVKVNVPCGPCHKNVCPLEEQVCMTQVTVDAVVAACEEQLRPQL